MYPDKKCWTGPFKSRSSWVKSHLVLYTSGNEAKWAVLKWVTHFLFLPTVNFLQSQDCQHATVFSGVLRMGFILWKHLGLLWYNWYFFPVKVVHCIIIRYSWTGGSLVWDNFAGLSGSRREYVTKCSFWSVSRRHSQALKPFLFLPAMKVLILFDPAETIRL